jgi:hypothetical protein
VSVLIVLPFARERRAPGRMSAHAASFQRASASPIDAHTAPVQDTRARSGRGGTALVLGILSLICSPIPGFG